MGRLDMKWFGKSKINYDKPSPEDMTPLQAVTHLCACIQLSDGDADFEERKVWLNTVTALFPSLSKKRADGFLNEAHLYINNANHKELLMYTEKILDRITEVLSTDQISKLGPMLKDLVEADGIVMTSELELSSLIERYLSIKINIDKNL